MQTNATSSAEQQVGKNRPFPNPYGFEVQKYRIIAGGVSDAQNLGAPGCTVSFNCRAERYECVVPVHSSMMAFLAERFAARGSADGETRFVVLCVDDFPVMLVGYWGLPVKLSVLEGSLHQPLFKGSVMGDTCAPYPRFVREMAEDAELAPFVTLALILPA